MRLAVADGTSVRVRGTTGSFSPVARVPAGWRVERLVWSDDADRLAWLAVQVSTGATRVVEAPAAGDGPVRQWTCAARCGTVAFRGDGLVADAMGSDATAPDDGSTAPSPAKTAPGTDETAPASVNRYPATGTADPEPLPLTGLSAENLGVERPVVALLLGTGGADGLLVVTAAAPGVSSAIHRVAEDGTTSLVHETGGTAVPRHGALSPDGTQLAYTVDRAVAGCPPTDTVVLVDVASGEGVPIAPSSATAPQFVSDVWFDEAGTVYAALLEGPGPCTGAPASTPTAPVTAEVYRRDGTTWKSTGARASQGADLGEGRTVLLTGPSTVGPDGVHRSPPGTLTLSDASGSDQILARAVTAFAVAPS
ncbi:hypothetical protein GCM10020369_31250 [Cryptosporangium minutisporangium]|uniref:WD40 repeat protein n=1 Tax=Cryptosporangium minutisporangium TaxID=113569 RepID=A0ABP6SX76_9ACTN